VLGWQILPCSVLGKIVGMASDLNFFFIGSPILSRKRDPSIMKHSGWKCLEQTSESLVGASQSFRLRLTALIHCARIASTLGNPWRL